MASATPMEDLPPANPESSLPATTPAAVTPVDTPAAGPSTVIPVDPPAAVTPPAPAAATSTATLPTNGAANEAGIDEDDGTQDTSVKKLELKVSGFIDVSGMVSTVAVLTLLLGQQTRNTFFAPLLIFISLSLVLQCVLAIILIIRHTFVEEARLPGESAEDIKKYNMKSRILLTVSSILLLLITIFNVFIVAFAGVANDSGTSSSSLTTSSPN